MRFFTRRGASKKISDTASFSDGAPSPLSTQKSAQRQIPPPPVVQSLPPLPPSNVTVKSSVTFKVPENKSLPSPPPPSAFYQSPPKLSMSSKNHELGSGLLTLGSASQTTSNVLGKKFPATGSSDLTFKKRAIVPPSISSDQLDNVPIPRHKNTQISFKNLPVVREDASAPKARPYLPARASSSSSSSDLVPPKQAAPIPRNMGFAKGEAGARPKRSESMMRDMQRRTQPQQRRSATTGTTSSDEEQFDVGHRFGALNSQDKTVQASSRRRAMGQPAIITPSATEKPSESGSIASVAQRSFSEKSPIRNSNFSMKGSSAYPSYSRVHDPRPETYSSPVHKVDRSHRQHYQNPSASSSSSLDVESALPVHTAPSLRPTHKKSFFPESLPKNAVVQQGFERNQSLQKTAKVSDQPTLETGRPLPRNSKLNAPSLGLNTIPSPRKLEQPLSRFAKAKAADRGSKSGILTHRPVNDTFPLEELSPYYAIENDTTVERRLLEAGVDIKLAYEAATQEIVKLHQKHLEETRELRRAFENELADVRAKMEAKHQREIQRLHAEMQDLEAAHVAQLNASREEERSKVALEEKLGGAAIVEHLLDVNAVARDFVGRMEERDTLMQSSLQTAKRNELRYLAQLRQSVTLESATKFARDGLSKGQALHIFLKLGDQRRELSDAFRRWVRYTTSQYRKTFGWRAKAREFGACSIGCTLTSCILVRICSAFHIFKANVDHLTTARSQRRAVGQLQRRTEALYVLSAALRLLIARQMFHAFTRFAKPTQKQAQSPHLKTSRHQQMLCRSRPNPTSSFAPVAGASPWDVPYYQHRLPHKGIRYTPEFIAIDTQSRRQQQAPSLRDNDSLTFLRDQYRVGLPLSSQGFGTRGGPEPVRDYRNMPLGSLGTGGAGYAANGPINMRDPPTSLLQRPEHNFVPPAPIDVSASAG